MSTGTTTTFTPPPPPLARAVRVPRALTVLEDKKERRCGACTECCTGSIIPTLNKPAHKRCDFERRDRPGCSCYESRPDECRTFKCLWLSGMGPDAHRPDRIGVFFTIYQTPEVDGVVTRNVPGALAAEHLNGQRRVLCAVETQIGAVKGSASSVIAEMRTVAPVMLIEKPS